MQQVIRLKPDDDIAAIRARLESVELSHAVLIVPRDCPALSTDRGLQLLRRAAEDAGIQVGLVVHDAGIRERAGAFGFPVFISPLEAQRTRWRMEPLREDRVQGSPRGSAGPSAGTSVMSPSERYRQWWAFVGVGIVFACVLCAVGVLFIPAANVRIAPSSIALSAATEFTADPSITQVNSETRSIPARRITHEISGTAQLKMTTEKSIPNAPSTGSVMFSNVRGELIEIAQGTIVKTSGGVPIRFTTTTTVTLPAGANSRVEVPIQAVDPGPTGNVKELTINTIDGSLNLEARVINLKPTASGSLKPVKVVTADDKKKLETMLLQQLKQAAAGVLQRDLKPTEFLPPDSVLVDTDNEFFDHSVDDPADVLNLRILATAYGLGVDQEDSVSLVTSMLQKQTPVGYQLLPNGVRVEPLGGGKYQGIALKMPVKAVGYSTPQVDSSKVAVALQGKSAEEAAAFLADFIPLARPADIKITPVGWNRMPWLAFRIVVFVEPQSVQDK